MKKIVLNISDYTYEKLRLEAMAEKKDILSILYDRIFHKPFSEEVKNAFEDLLQKGFEKINKE